MSRIEVPLTLSPPRFEDESTVASARQVEPIGRARIAARGRKLFAQLPLLIAAVLCGALGAAAVNYLESRQAAVSGNSAVLVRNEPSPSVISASSDLNGNKPNENYAASTDTEEPVVKIKEEPKEIETEAKPVRRTDDSPAQPALKTPRKIGDSETAKLTRQRRVRPAEKAPSPVDKNGASRILDVFSGPNPEPR